MASLTAANFHGAYRRDGAVFRNALRLIPLCDDAGEVTHFVGLIRDVTHATGVDRLTGLLDRYGLLDRLSALNTCGNHLAGRQGRHRPISRRQ